MSTKELTAGELYGRAMQMKTKEEAEKYLDELTDICLRLRPLLSRAEAREIQLKNIGYWSGYYPRDTAKRVLELFDTRHPIFGRYEHDWPPDEILGMAVGTIVSESKPEHQKEKADRAEKEE